MPGYAHMSRSVCFRHFFFRQAPIVFKEVTNRTLPTQTANLFLNYTNTHNSLYLSSYSLSLCSYTTPTTSGTTHTLYSNNHSHYPCQHHTQQNRRYKFTNKLCYIQKRLLHATRVDNMKFVQFLKTATNGTQRRGLGVELPLSGEIVDLVEADPTIPSDMKTFLEGARTHLVKASRWV